MSRQILKEEKIHESKIKVGTFELDSLRAVGSGEPDDGTDAQQGALKNGQKDARSIIHGEGQTPGREFRDKGRVAGPAWGRRNVLSENYRWATLPDEDRPRAEKDRSASNLQQNRQHGDCEAVHRGSSDENTGIENATKEYPLRIGRHKCFEPDTGHRGARRSRRTATGSRSLIRNVPT